MVLEGPILNTPISLFYIYVKEKEVNLLINDKKQ